MIKSLNNVKAMPKGLGYKLLIAFGFMSIVPLLTAVYLITMYVYPQSDFMVDASLPIVVAFIISLLGLVFVKKLIGPITEMAQTAKMIANGEYHRKFLISGNDEIGALGQSINTMTDKIRANLDELEQYGQKTRKINMEINKKVLALSNLLHLGDSISTGSMELDSILELAVKKAAAIFDDGYAVLYLSRDGVEDQLVHAAFGLMDEKLGDLTVRSGQGVLGRVMRDHVMLILDNSAKPAKDTEDFRNSYRVKNMIVMPVYYAKRDFGVLVIGNREDGYTFKDDELDLAKVFARHITIALEKDFLLKVTKELAVKDEATDLYNKSYILVRTEEEIKRAIFYQRPCSFVLFDIDDFNKLREARGELVGQDVLKKLAKVIKDSIGPIGRAARIDEDKFAVLLPEKNKKESTRIAEDIRRRIEATNFAKEGKIDITISGGVSENPIDGSTCDELFEKANDCLRYAKSLGKNKIVA